MSPLVETKLYAPRVRRDVVARPRLIDLLRRGAEARLTLISAPAGFGKTTMLATWLAGAAAGGRAVAWLSAEDRDASFWTYVVTALERAAPGVGATALALLESGQAPIETVLAMVLNNLSGRPGELDLVLDDYHLAEGPEHRAGMAFLLEHLPPHVHVVISTRSDPALPLARLRASGELVEIRAADLRFTADEVAAYLNDVVGLGLTPDDIRTLQGRTEGWIAALQLAALSIRGRDARDAAGFIAGFAGDDRYIVDYLVDEVLERQPADVRRFLLDTCILERLSGPLCDAVIGGGGRTSKAMLEALDRANLFVVPLDDTRRWYRYHQLFADVLRTHLADEPPGEVRERHRRAGIWYGEAGDTVLAVRHALAAGDAGRAADLVELTIPALRRDRREATAVRLLEQLPDEIVRTRPVLAVGLAGALLAGGVVDGVAQRLDDAEALLATPAPIVVDRRELSRVPGQIEMFRAALALVAGDPAATVRHADEAVRRAPDDDHLTRSAASALGGLARWGAGDLDAAHRAYAAAVRGLQRAGHRSDVLGCSITLADIRSTQGRLGDALRTYEEAISIAEQPLRGIADMYVGLSQIACERGDLDAARGYLERSHALGEEAGLPQNAYRWRVAMAHVRQAEGDLVAARELLDDAQRVYVGDFSPNVRPVPALRARVLLALGNLREAQAWAREQGLSPDDDLSYVREFEHITLARILLAQPATRGDGLRLLDRLAVAAEAGGRFGNLIEILVLQALARRAVEPLRRALELAGPEGYVQVFLSEGPAMTSLLATLPGAAYLRPGPEKTGQTALVEPLSEREMDVLRLLATDLDGPEIARRLVVSLNTVRTHTKHIYAKLGVTNRRAAVRQAHHLKLLRG